MTAPKEPDAVLEELAAEGAKVLATLAAVTVVSDAELQALQLIGDALAGESAAMGTDPSHRRRDVSRILVVLKVKAGIGRGMCIGVCPDARGTNGTGDVCRRAMKR